MSTRGADCEGSCFREPEEAAAGGFGALERAAGVVAAALAAAMDDMRAIAVRAEPLLDDLLDFGAIALKSCPGVGRELRRLPG